MGAAAEEGTVASAVGPDPTQRLDTDEPPTDGSMDELGAAMDRVLASENLDPERDTDGLGGTGRQRSGFDIDLDNLDVEDLVPAKYSDD